MNGNTVRLAVGVVSAWLVGAAGGLAVLPSGMKVFAICGAFVAFVCIALWNAGPRRKRRWREGPYATAELADFAAVARRYRLGWLLVLAVVVMGMGGINAVSFADAALAVTGEPVTARVVRSEPQGESFVDCTVERLDGTPIAGTLHIAARECPERPEVLVDPLGLLDPALREEGKWGLTVFVLILLAGALVLCVPTARVNPAEDGPNPPLTEAN